MPSTGIKLLWATVMIVAAACSMPERPPLFARSPDAVSGPITRAEAEIAINEMLAVSQQVCMAWPPLWAEENERAQLVVRYDLMRRDWGQAVSDGRERRMDEFVAMGFLEKWSDAGDNGAATYTFTEAGRRYLRDAETPEGPQRFCAPVERRVVAITSVSEGVFQCGSTHVRFTHVADTPPLWAQGDGPRARWAAAAAPVGQVGEGAVTLARRRNGLQSLCSPADLDLSPPAN
jgi:hypothetical protein